MNTCAICRNKFEAESPAILFISAYGTPRVLCSDCEALLDRATAEESSDDKAQATNALIKHASFIKDPEVLEMLSSLLSDKSEPEAPTENEAEIESVFEEIREEEKKKENEKPARMGIVEMIAMGALVLGIAAFLVWFYFFR